MRTRDYREGLLKRLRSKSYAASLLREAFVESCRDGDWQAFGIVLKDIIDAQGG